jgi:hypothetical protein
MAPLIEVRWPMMIGTSPSLFAKASEASLPSMSVQSTTSRCCQALAHSK